MRVVVDKAARAIFWLVFDEANYNQAMTMEAWYAGELIDQKEIDFFTEMPERLG